MIHTYLNKINQQTQYQLSLASIVNETISDGIGIRLSIYFNGCIHHCQECHNPQTWRFNDQKIITMDDITKIVNLYKKNPLLSGISLSGGDPLYNPEGMILFIQLLKNLLGNINIWCYTGYQFEHLIMDDITAKFLTYIDVLVDGPYQKHNRVYNIPFIGSSNQRIIDVKASLLHHSVIELE